MFWLELTAVMQPSLRSRPAFETSPGHQELEDDKRMGKDPPPSSHMLLQCVMELVEEFSIPFQSY